MKLKQFNFKKVKSTNQTAIRLIKSSKNEFGLIVSEAQSKGKGQYGRKWISYKGNIFLSFFYKLENINLSLTSLTKKNCFLVKDVISRYYSRKITFKSPNDLLINKKKICGILQEKIEKSKNQYFVVGIGFNLIKSYRRFSLQINSVFYLICPYLFKSIISMKEYWYQSRFY